MKPESGIGRSRFAMMGAFAATSVANYAFSLLMGRLLLPGDFGALAFVQTLLLIAGLVLESGIPWSLARDLVGAEPDARVALIRGATLSNLALALALAGLMVTIFAAGPLRSGLESWPITLLAAVALPLIALVGVARGAAQGTERYGTLALVSSCEVISKAISGTLMVALGFGVAGAVGGFVVGAGLSVALGILKLGRALPLFPWRETRRMTVRMAGPMFGALLGAALLLNLDLLLLKVFPGGGRIASGQYQASIVLANAPYFLASSVLVPLVFPQMVRRSSLAATAPEMGRVLRLAALGVIPLELGLILMPGPVLSVLFPATYSEAALPLQWRAVGTALLILVTLLSAAYQATGHARLASTVLLGLSGLEVLLLSGAIPAFGVTGASVVFAGVMLLTLLSLGTHYILQLRSADRHAARAWLLRYALSLAGAGLIFLVSPWLRLSILPSALLTLLVFALLSWVQRLHVGPRPIVDSLHTTEAA